MSPIWDCQSIPRKKQIRLPKVEFQAHVTPDEDEYQKSVTSYKIHTYQIGDNCGSESSTLETDVCVWRYAPLVVLATKEEEISFKLEKHFVTDGRMCLWADKH